MLETLIRFWPNLLEGFFLTLELVVLCGILGFIVAVPIALACYSTRAWLKVAALRYIWFFRGTPLLVQLFLVYYGLAQFELLKHSMLWRGLLDSPYGCAILALSLNTAAYVAEILRGSIKAIPAGEIDAAKSLGMSRHTRMRRIIFPSALRLSIPALGNEAILLVKGSALASTVTLMEFTGVIKTLISRTYQPIEFYFLAALVYILINVSLARLFRFFGRLWPYRHA